MSIVKQFFLECDLFAHGSLQRYKQQQGFRTLVGGITSVILIMLFIIVFFNLVINTFSMKIINAQVSTSYDDDPTYTELTTDPTKNYMFAIGLTGIDLSSSQRYFDIVLNNKANTKNGSNTVKTSKAIPLSPCNISQWSGVTSSITNSYTTQSFNQWLCPPIGTVIPLQGKFTSDIFKYAQLVISPCTDNSLYPNTTCKSTQNITSFLTANTQFTLNVYLINPVLNPGDPNFISYYLEDSNYFSFDATTGISANLFYNDYKVTSDNSIMPWTETSDVTGAQILSTAVGQIYQIKASKVEYFKFYWRKAANKVQINRTFQKLDQTLSYIGGLFGTIILLLIFLKFYSKYSYQLDIGDKIFKDNNGGSFGAQNFNFIVFLGYSLFNIVSKFGVILNWKTMKKYHRCRMQCLNQLNLDLLMRKISHFEQISRIVLQDHHLKMLLMAPKPTIKQAKYTRKKYLIKSIIYHQLQRKGRDYYIEDEQHKQRFHQFLVSERDIKLKEIAVEQESETSIRAIHDDFIECYKKTQQQINSDNFHSRKILERLKMEKMIHMLIQFIKSEPLPNDRKKEIAPQSSKQPLSLQIIEFARNQRPGELNANQIQVDTVEITKTRLMNDKEKL